MLSGRTERKCRDHSSTFKMEVLVSSEMGTGAISPGVKARGVTLTTYLQVVPRSTSTLPHAFMA
jgi:hypothetical protein